MDDYILKVMIREQLADRQRHAARARLRHGARSGKKHSGPDVRAVAWDRLGNLLIRLGRSIKERYGLGPEPVEKACCRSRA